MKVRLDDKRAAPAGSAHVRTPDAAIELRRGGDVEQLRLAQARHEREPERRPLAK